MRPPPGTDLGAGGMIGESSHSVASRRLAEHFQNVLQSIQLRSQKRASLGDLAAAFGVSPRHLNRLFRSACGTSPVRAYRKQQLLEAQKQIAESDRPIEVIAEELRYSDRSSFARAFRRALGLYPGSVRRRVRHTPH